jgi:hypothetical protein
MGKQAHHNNNNNHVSGTHILSTQEATGEEPCMQTKDRTRTLQMCEPNQEYSVEPIGIQ